MCHGVMFVLEFSYHNLKKISGRNSFILRMQKIKVRIFYHLLDAKILASPGSPIITQLVGLFFDGDLHVLYFATNLNSTHIPK